MLRTAIAFAKINLALHVRRRRADGYHALETLFAFLDAGDTLAVQPAEAFRLETDGPFAGKAGPDDDNLVTRAARLAHGGSLPPLHVRLTKQLPVAAGLGGGSADAAALFRLMGADDRHDLAAMLGADIPACLASQPVIGRGTGTELLPVANDVQGLACLLVNPNVPLSTGPVFKAWDGEDRGAMPGGSARQIMLAGRNDLEAPAISLCPVIAEVLDWLARADPLLARMSGSGASCFALFETLDEARDAARRCVRDQPGWWTIAGLLR